MPVQPAQRLSMKSVLPEVMDRFEEVATQEPGRLDPRHPDGPYFVEDSVSILDAFGNFRLGAFATFQEIASDCLGGDGSSLMPRFNNAHLGIGTVVAYTEVVALKHLEDEPDREITPAIAATTAINGYGFIDDVFESGGVAAVALVRAYMTPLAGHLESWRLRGTIIGDELAYGTRLDLFDLVGKRDSEQVVVPHDWESTMAKARQAADKKTPPKVNCPAHIYEHEETGITQAKRLFGILVRHAEKHIYPSYIPHAKEVLLNTGDRPAYTVTL